MGLWDRAKKFCKPGEGASPRSTATTTDPRDAFIAMVEHLARQTPGLNDTRRVPEQFAITYRPEGTDEDSTFFLNNVFQETRDMSPEERVDRVRKLLRSWAEPMDGEALRLAAVDHLLPVLRAPSLFGVSEVPPAFRPFVPHLVEALVVDLEESMSFVTHQNLREWGLDESGAFQQAGARLAACLGAHEVECYDPDSPYRIWHVASHDSYEASRLLVPGWLAAFEGRVAGKPIAVVPHNNLLVVSGDGDERAVERLISIGDAEYRGSPRTISPALYTVDGDGAVVPFVLPRAHRLAASVRRGHIILAAEEYAAQKHWIEERDGADNMDVFLASYFGLDHPDHGPTSQATWSVGVPTLLPIVERVVFVGGDLESKRTWTVVVPWAAVEEVVGDLLEPVPSMYPPRMRTLGWPDEEALERLRERAIAV